MMSSRAERQSGARPPRDGNTRSQPFKDEPSVRNRNQLSGAETVAYNRQLLHDRPRDAALFALPTGQVSSGVAWALAATGEAGTKTGAETWGA
jgi:hypothetical protein